MDVRCQRDRSMMRKRGVIGRSNNEEIEENEQRHLIKKLITTI